jgi:4'-phosphopantetheinyl transferase
MSKSSALSWHDRFESLQQQAHVWYCNPQAIFDPDRLEQYLALLSGAERKQQRNFHFKKDQRSYLVSHALVRKALSLYAEILPQDWVFGKGARGKPKLAEASAATSLRFNLTHTADLCACVVTRGIRCGLDAEYIGRQNKLMPIARRMFSEIELETLKGKTDSEIQQRFYSYWTLREAYVKAMGTGLGGSSKAFHFSIDEHDSAANCKSARIEFTDRKKTQLAAQWQFEIFQHEANHVMAVALKSAGEHKTIQWQFMEP